jgi:hypothetical protein
MLFGLNIGPITSSAGFLSAPPEKAAGAFQHWQNSLLAGRNIELQHESIEGSIESMLQRLAPLTSPVPTKFLFIPTASCWTAFVSNSWRGTDASGSMSVLAKLLDCTALRVLCVNHTLPTKVTKEARGQYGATIFEVYSVDGSVRRTIYAANDGGKWKFGQSGEPFNFENQSAYKTTKVRDRFTQEMLKQNLAGLGLFPFEKNWYLPPNDPAAILVTRHGERVQGYTEHSLEDVLESWIGV